MPAEPKFIFILGAARSGTKFLREILGASTEVRIVPFDVNYVWRHGNEAHPNDALPPEMASAAIGDYIRRTLDVMATTHSKRKIGTIVEKTVSNTLRAEFVHRIFPDAKFVHLIRDGRDVAESAARMWRAPVGYRYLLKKIRYFQFSNLQYAFWFVRNQFSGTQNRSPVWGPRYPHIEEDLIRLDLTAVVARQWLWSVESTLSGLQNVPVEQCFSLTYEHLVGDQSILHRLLEFAEIQDTETVLNAFEDRVRSDSIGKWMRLQESDRRIIAEIQAPMLERLGYLSR